MCQLMAFAVEALTAVAESIGAPKLQPPQSVLDASTGKVTIMQRFPYSTAKYWQHLNTPSPQLEIRMLEGHLPPVECGVGFWPFG